MPKARLLYGLRSAVCSMNQNRRSYCLGASWSARQGSGLPTHDMCRSYLYLYLHLPPGWKADLSRADNYLDTPLHIAASRGDLALVRLLVAGGADACAKKPLE